jgi:MFS family permease
MDPIERNLILGVTHEALWGAALGLVNPFTILPLAAHDLGRGVADAGLLEASLFAGCNAVQLWSAFAFQPRWTDPKRTAWMHAPALAITLLLALLMLSPLPDGLRWGLLLAGVTLHWMGLGVVVPHWATLSSRNVPPELLGRYFGWCFSAAGLCTIFSGILGARLAQAGGAHWGYAACFGLAFVVQALSVWLLGQTRPLAPAPQPPGPLAVFLKERWQAARRSRLWLGFGVIVVCLQFASASTQLFTSFAKDHGHANGDFELFNPALALGATLGAVGLGWLLDRRGPALALGLAFVPLLAGLWLLPAGLGLGADAAAFLCAGLFNAVFGSVMIPWLLRLAHPRQHPAFMGLYGTFTAPWNLAAPWLLGRLAREHGYGAAFSVSALAALAGALALALLPAHPSLPRQEAAA